MSKFSFNKSLIVALITAIMFLQLSTQHIHLAGKHEHGNGEHQHVATVHQHQTESHHSDAIDIAEAAHSHTDSTKVVELDTVCTQCQSKQEEKLAVFFLPQLIYLERVKSSQLIVSTNRQETYQSYHQYTSISLRAPPVNS